MGCLRRRYGAHPAHLLLMVASFAVAGYAVTRVQAQGGLLKLLAWFVGAVILHDLVLWPLYTWADRVVRGAFGRRWRRPPLVPWINHLRVPAVMSAVVLFISFPLVLRLSSASYASYTGLSESRYLGHWLLVTAVLFASSAVVYLLRLGRARRRPGVGSPSE